MDETNLVLYLAEVEGKKGVLYYLNMEAAETLSNCLTSIDELKLLLNVGYDLELNNELKYLRDSYNNLKGWLREFGGREAIDLSEFSFKEGDCLIKNEKGNLVKLL